MKHYYDMKLSLFDRIFGIECPHCHKRGGMKSGCYVRGYNEWCTQAYGDDGFFCKHCQKLTYRISHEESRRTAPAWCIVYPDTDKRKHFPDFKHNSTRTLKLPDHESHKYKGD